MYRYACLLETPNRSMITDKASSLEEPSLNRERAALTRSASSACGDLLLMCHNYTTFCVICQALFFVPNSGISHRLFKLKVIYCVGGVSGPPCGVPSFRPWITPPTITPASRYRRSKCRSRLSFTILATRAISTSWLTRSKNFSKSKSTTKRYPDPAYPCAAFTASWPHRPGRNP